MFWRPKESVDFGPSISVDVQKVKDNNELKPRSLVINAAQVKCMNGNSASWQFPSSEIHSVQVSRHDPTRFTVSVLQKFEFAGESAAKVQQAIDAFRAFDIGLVKPSVIPLPPPPIAPPPPAPVLVKHPCPFCSGTGDASGAQGIPATVRAQTALSAPAGDRIFNFEREFEAFANQQPSMAASQTPLCAANTSNSVPTSTAIVTDDGRAPQRADELDFVRVIGEGAFAQVMLARKCGTNQQFAVKVIRMNDHPKGHDVYAERNILKALDHPLVVHLHFAFEHERKLYLGMDYIQGGELYYHLKRAGRFSIDAARFIMAEIICALEYVHSQNIVYRDLKPENVLLDAEGHIRLADFGLAKQNITSDGSNSGTKAQTFCGTPQYLAPEILSGQPYSKSVDYWSAGVLFYELLTGAVPFYSSNRQELYAQTIQGEISFPVYVAKEAQSLVRGILVRNPEDRLGSGVLGSLELKQHPFFRGTRWADIDNRSLEPPYKPKIDSAHRAKLSSTKSINRESEDSSSVENSDRWQLSTVTDAMRSTQSRPSDVSGESATSNADTSALTADVLMMASQRRADSVQVMAPLSSGSRSASVTPALPMELFGPPTPYLPPPRSQRSSDISSTAGSFDVLAGLTSPSPLPPSAPRRASIGIDALLSDTHNSGPNSNSGSGSGSRRASRDQGGAAHAVDSLDSLWTLTSSSSIRAPHSYTGVSSSGVHSETTLLAPTASRGHSRSRSALSSTLDGQTTLSAPSSDSATSRTRRLSTRPDHVRSGTDDIDSLLNALEFRK